jgi:hypothetical protein
MERKAVKEVEQAMVRWVIIRGGMVALGDVSEMLVGDVERKRMEMLGDKY